jgi:hypothetical protein
VELQEWPLLAVQVDGGALCVAERPHGDGDGTGQGGRGRALQGQRRVRFSRLYLRVVGLRQCGGGRSVDFRAELQERLFWLCRATALHYASLTGHTETALALVKAGADVHSKSNDGCGSRGCILVSLGRHGAGADGPSVRVWSCRSGCSGLCRWTAVHYASQNGHTETAMALVKAGADVRCKSNGGCGFSRLHPRVCGLPRCRIGRSVHSGMELQEWLLRLCRWTALHSASRNGHTETAMALVEAGADVHCKANDGYGSTGDFGTSGIGLHSGERARRARGRAEGNGGDLWEGTCGG